MSSYKIIIGEQEYSIKEADLVDLDLVKTAPHQFHILQDGQAFTASLGKTNFANKTLTININGNNYELKIEDKYDQLVKQMGFSTNNSQKIKEVKAPMPGLVLDILVEPNQAISKGDALLILEAMKMENVLKAEGDGIIKSIEVSKGATVDKGQVIIEME